MSERIHSNNKSNETNKKSQPQLEQSQLKPDQELILKLQRTIGNQAVMRYLQRMPAGDNSPEQANATPASGGGDVLTGMMVNGPTVVTAMGPATILPGPITITNAQMSGGTASTPEVDTNSPEALESPNRA